MEMIPGTDKVRAELGGINADITLDGSFKGLHFIPLDATGVKVTNATAVFILEQVPNADKVHWSLVDSSSFHFDSLDIKMKSSFLQKLVDLSRKLIDKMINDQMPKLSKAIDAQVQALNAKVASENATSFVVPIMDGVAVNLTMAHSPITEKDSNLIGIFFDGMIVGDKVAVTNDDIVTLPPRQEHDLSEQFFIHEDMVNALVQQLEDKIFPLEVSQKSIADEMKQVFREIPQFYGNDCTITMKLNMDAHEGKPINFDKTHGIILGNKNDITTTLELVVSNATTVNDTAVVFTLNLEAHANVSLKDFVVWPNIEEVYS